MNRRTRLIISAAVVSVVIGVIIGIIGAIKYRNKYDCEINPLLDDRYPLVFLSGTKNFIYPNVGENVLKFSHGQSIDFVCPGRKLLINSVKTDLVILPARCLSNYVFVTIEGEVNSSQLRCDETPSRTARYTGNTCQNSGQEIEIGFEVDNNTFYKSFMVCFDQVTQEAYYSFNNLTASINQRASSTPRPSWMEVLGIYDIGPVSSLYNRNNQRRTINSLVGLPENSTKYIEDNTNFFLSRGHLTARSDKFYPAQQNSTFFMMNVAPQWQTFNGYNWKQLEAAVRDYAEDNEIDLMVWTGVHGVATLPHEVTKDEIELYLYINNTTSRKALPVPAIYWKVAYNPITQFGVALIGVNNPYIENLITICDDVLEDIKWVQLNNNNRESGYCYACTINSFRQVVTSLPDISVRGLLL